MPRIAQHVEHTASAHHHASTGPRHRCRGSLLKHLRHPLGVEASTGPRHRCRGSILSASNISSGVELQRGLGIDAEDRSASWGEPRSRTCFNGASASMPRIGPRAQGWSGSRSGVLQRGLGIDAEDRPRSRAARSQRCRFNGASASMPRIGTRSPRRADQSSSFNGASASMPRIGSWLRPPRSTGRSLQRGLGIDAEDRPLTIELQSMRPRLQRGLGIDAEDRSRSESWSPGAASASTGPRHRCRGSENNAGHDPRRADRFNGASASMPRIGPPVADPEAEAYSLQRGLGIDAEDRGGVAEDEGALGDASTGPRHRCRGSTVREARAREAKKLQRGLGIDAEDRGARSARRGRGVFASTGPRHRCRGSGSDACALPLSGDSAASTGPRHRCRGSLTLPPCATRGEGGFNGASASMPRIAFLRSRARPPRPCFNGASASMPRIGGSSWGRGAHCTSFNGASASMPRIGRERSGWRVGGAASTGPRHRCRGSRVLPCGGSFP